MSYTLPPLPLIEGQTTQVNIPGQLSAVTYVKLVNASPYLVLLNNVAAGQDYLQPGEANVWKVDGLTSAIQATPQAILATPNITPVSLLIVTWYTTGEQPQGQYPVNFNLLQYLGNSVTVNSATNTLEQDLFTPFVLSGLFVSKDGVTANQLDVTAGVAYPRQPDASLLRQSLANSAFLTATPSTVYFLDLNPDGSWSWGTNHSAQSNYLAIAQVTTDGSGNIASVTDEAQRDAPFVPGLFAYVAVTRLKTTHGIVLIDLSSPSDTGSIGHSQGTTGIGAFTDTDPAAVLFTLGPGASIFTPFGIGQFAFPPSTWIDTAGLLHAGGSPVLASGNQETGACGYTFTATGAGQAEIVVVNFKQVMTTVPTSITLTPSSTVNFSSIIASGITKYGFQLVLTGTAAGLVRWVGTYTTVGN